MLPGLAFFYIQCDPLWSPCEAGVPRNEGLMMMVGAERLMMLVRAEGLMMMVRAERQATEVTCPGHKSPLLQSICLSWCNNARVNTLIWSQCKIQPQARLGPSEGNEEECNYYIVSLLKCHEPEKCHANQCAIVSWVLFVSSAFLFCVIPDPTKQLEKPTV